MVARQEQMKTHTHKAASSTADAGDLSNWIDQVSNILIKVPELETAPKKECQGN